VEDDEIRILVGRLSRRHPSGGKAIARAAIMAEGADATEVIRWILDHDGQPEAGAAASGPAGGLHDRRAGTQMAASDRPPVRYIVPAAALAAPARDSAAELG
jgi:hypothetical protein